VFEPQSRKTSNPNVPRLLIIDGHNSHTTVKFLEYAHEHNIIVLCLPPHTTHYLQPCDVGVFGPLSRSWKAEVERSFNKGIPITRYNLIETYAKARLSSFKHTTIESAFRKTGIWPPNPAAIPAEAYGPSQANSTRAILPGLTPLPNSQVTIADHPSEDATQPIVDASADTRGQCTQDMVECKSLLCLVLYFC
jgi:DDE superfamily endonuclease